MPSIPLLLKIVNEEKKIQRRDFKGILFFLGLLSVSSNYINRTAMFFRCLHSFYNEEKLAISVKMGRLLITTKYNVQ